MIAISSDSGALLKVIPWEPGKVVGYHPLFGFVSADTFTERQRNRIRHHFKATDEHLHFQFEFAGQGEQQLRLVNPKNCQLAPTDKGWSLAVGEKKYWVAPCSGTEASPVELRRQERDRSLIWSFVFAFLLPLLFLVLPKGANKKAEPVVVEQVMVKIKPEVQKPVAVSVVDRIPTTTKQAQIAKRAIKQDLGFLGLIGRKDLTKAVGGAPTALKDVSPGAGPGGKQGSGGEMLVGLGEGLKRVTVGNSGVAGLGGIGTKGAGGGAGGYGNTSIGSGEGRALSAAALSQDVTLEGGLDRSVVRATIAKYLNQVRACYETGLKRNSALSGQVTMNFEIAGTGALNFAKVHKSSLGDSDVEQCISQRMMNWRFPQSRGGVSTRVSYPFALRSARG